MNRLPGQAAVRRSFATLLHPIEQLRSYRRADLLPDLLAGITVAAVLLPQAIAFALVAGVDPAAGLYTAVIGSIIGALWGSSQHLHTGPTNTASVLVLSTLSPLFMPGSPDYLTAAGLLAVMAGVFRIIMGLARLGLLVHFVSDSVVIGFTAGAGILIATREVRHLLGLPSPVDPSYFGTVWAIVTGLPGVHWLSLAVGLATLALIIGMKRFAPRWPGALVGMVGAGAATALLALDQAGVRVLGELPRSLPPPADLPLFDLELLGALSTGALAVAAIGLVEATSIGRSVAVRSGQRIDSNQEFIGQGVANIACGVFSGYSCSGSFNRSALNYDAGAHSWMAAALSGVFVLIVMLGFSGAAAFLPRPALSAVLFVAAYGMVDRREMLRILRTTFGDATIMVVTLLATVLLPLPFAVLTGILMSFAYYIVKTSAPRVEPVVPDDRFRHLVHQPDKPACPQLGIVDVHGDLYFGSVGHIEEELRRHQLAHPSQRFLLMRLRSVDHCDISGIHMLESVLRLYRERGGDVYLVHVTAPVLERMRATGFLRRLGDDHILDPDTALEYLFYRVLDPAICIYESNVRVFRECQNLPRPEYTIHLEVPPEPSEVDVPQIAARELWERLRNESDCLAIDVREPREYMAGHVPGAQNVPLSRILAGEDGLPTGRPLVLVCRSGRRSLRAAAALRARDYAQLQILDGGMIAWENEQLLEALNSTV
jgi:SulP family sulfate permease